MHSALQPRQSRVHLVERALHPGLQPWQPRDNMLGRGSHAGLQPRRPKVNLLGRVQPADILRHRQRSQAAHARAMNSHVEMGGHGSKPDGMVDVKSTRCEHFGCTIQPSFGYPGANERFCSTHKLEGMIDMNSKHCEHDGCTVQSFFGNLGAPGTTVACTN